MKKTDQRFDPIQLEDLFELKRNEKPQADFWDDFDAQLQQRILNSAIDRRSILQRGWDLVSAKLLPVSAIATVTAAVAISIAPIFQQTSSVQPNENLSASSASITAVAISQPVSIDAVDFHNETLSATVSVETASHSFKSYDISHELQASADYETNALVVSAHPQNLNFEEQLF